MSIAHVSQGGHSNQAFVLDDCKAVNGRGRPSHHHVVGYAELQHTPKFAITDPNWWTGKRHEYCTYEPVRGPFAEGRGRGGGVPAGIPVFTNIQSDITGAIGATSASCNGDGCGMETDGQPDFSKLHPQFSALSVDDSLHNNLGVGAKEQHHDYPMYTTYNARLAAEVNHDQRNKGNRNGAKGWCLYNQGYMETGEETDQCGRPFGPEGEAYHCLCPRGWTRPWCL
jgi:hypothetical protein